MPTDLQRRAKARFHPTPFCQTSMTSSKHISLEFNLHEKDQSFPDVKKEYTVYYDRINSESSGSTSLPLLVLLHREHIPLLNKFSIPDNQEC